LRTIIHCLKTTDRKESEDAIFNIVKRLSADMFNILKNSIIEVLFKLNSSLENNQKKRIDERRDELLRSTYTKTRERGKELSNHSR
jgi:hypothetical protein